MPSVVAFQWTKRNEVHHDFQHTGATAHTAVGLVFLPLALKQPVTSIALNSPLYIFSIIQCFVLFCFRASGPENYFLLASVQVVLFISSYQIQTKTKVNCHV